MKILLSMVLFLCLSGTIFAQPKDGVLVADETWFVKSGKTGFRVITCNDSVSCWMIKKFANTGKANKVTHTVKKDRHGYYWERSFYFKDEEYNDVAIFLNSLNKNVKK